MSAVASLENQPSPLGGPAALNVLDSLADDDFGQSPPGEFVPTTVEIVCAIGDFDDLDEFDEEDFDDDFDDDFEEELADDYPFEEVLGGNDSDESDDEDEDIDFDADEVDDLDEDEEVDDDEEIEDDED